MVNYKVLRRRASLRARFRENVCSNENYSPERTTCAISNERMAEALGAILCSDGRACRAKDALATCEENADAPKGSYARRTPLRHGKGLKVGMARLLYCKSTKPGNSRSVDALPLCHDVDVRRHHGLDGYKCGPRSARLPRAA